MRIAPHDVIFFITWFSWFEMTARFGLEQTGEQVALRLDEVADAEHAVVDVVEVHDGLVADELDLASDDRVRRPRAAARRRAAPS